MILHVILSFWTSNTSYLLLLFSRWQNCPEGHSLRAPPSKRPTSSLLSASSLVFTEKWSVLLPAASSFTQALCHPFPDSVWHSLSPQDPICFVIVIVFVFSPGSFPWAYKCGAIVSIFKRKNPFFTLFPLSATILFFYPLDSKIPWKSCLDLMCL